MFVFSFLCTYNQTQGDRMDQPVIVAFAMVVDVQHIPDLTDAEPFTHKYEHIKLGVCWYMLAWIAIK